MSETLRDRLERLPHCGSADWNTDAAISVVSACKRCHHVTGGVMDLESPTTEE